MKLHVRRYLCLLNLHLKKAIKGLMASRVRATDPLFGAPERSRDEGDAVSRFFIIVVEVPEGDKALIRLMQVNPSVAATIQLPSGFQFRTCFEISAEYANVVINM